MTKRRRRTYTAEQKADAVRLAREVGNVAKVARDLDLPQSVLYSWLEQADAKDAQEEGGGSLTSEEKAELRRLRREVNTLRMERDFLKKAAAFFAKDQDRPSS